MKQKIDYEIQMYDFFDLLRSTPSEKLKDNHDALDVWLATLPDAKGRQLFLESRGFSHNGKMSRRNLANAYNTSEERVRQMIEGYTRKILNDTESAARFMESLYGTSRIQLEQVQYVEGAYKLNGKELNPVDLEESIISLHALHRPVLRERDVIHSGIEYLVRENNSGQDSAEYFAVLPEKKVRGVRSTQALHLFYV